MLPNDNSERDTDKLRERAACAHAHTISHTRAQTHTKKHTGTRTHTVLRCAVFYCSARRNLKAYS